jgi:hypothetical protein
MNESSEKKNATKVKPTPVVIIAVVFLVLWSWGNREKLIPQSGKLSDIELVKSNPFPDNPVLPIGPAFDFISSKCTWEQFLTPNGAQVVQVSGIVSDETIKTQILNDKWNISKVCKNLPLVVKFYNESGNAVKDYESFHAACVNPKENPDVVDEDGFAEAARQYIPVYNEHFKATVQFKVQFLMFVKRNNSKTTSILPGYNEPFIVGFTSVTLSSGLYANLELAYPTLTEIITEN